MKKQVKRFVFAALFSGVAAISLVSWAAAQDCGLKCVWGGGKPSASTYSRVYVPHIIKVLEENRLAGYQWGGPTQGTVDNAERVSKNPTHLAVGQLDILRSLQGKPLPDGKGNYRFTILHENIGPECLYAFTKAKGYKNLGHVVGNAWDITIYTGGKKSGSFGTLKVLMELFPQLKDARVVNVGSADKIAERVKQDPSGFGFFVMRPDPNSALFKKLINEGYTFIPVVDFELEGKYEFKELKLAHGGLFSKPVMHTTACTSVALITGDPETVDPNNTRVLRRLQATIKRIGALSSEALRPNLSSWRDMWDSIKAVSANKARQLMEASKRTLDDLARKAQQQ